MDSKRPSPTPGEPLPELITRLGQDVVKMIEARLALLKLEIVEDIETMARQGLWMVLGAVLAIVGVALLCLSLGFAVAVLLPTDLGEPARYALGFAAVAIAAVPAGVLMALNSYRRMRQGAIHPERSLMALEEDKRWIRRQDAS